MDYQYFLCVMELGYTLYGKHQYTRINVWFRCVDFDFQELVDSSKAAVCGSRSRMSKNDISSVVLLNRMKVTEKEFLLSNPSYKTEG